MSFDSISSVATGCFPRRAHTITAPDEAHNYMVTVYMHCFNPEDRGDRVCIDLHKRSTTEELIDRVISMRPDLIGQSAEDFDIFEMMVTPDGQASKERRLDRGEYPVAAQLIWSRMPGGEQAVSNYRFVFRHKGARTGSSCTRFGSAEAASTIDSFLAKFLQQPHDREYADLCMLPELTEQTLLDNLRDRFNSGHIYTYIGPILVAVNPFSFFPIYNPKYARLYSQSRKLGTLPPHIFAIADVTYHNMLRIKESQCVVISGESGSDRVHQSPHVTSDLPLTEGQQCLHAFGNAVTLQNNNSSRFGKFIKINYRDNGMVSGANVEIYLLEKSRIISQAKDERNYHVFYYLLEGASDQERSDYFLLKPQDYHYLNQHEQFSPEGVNEKYEFERLRKAMSSVGFNVHTQSTMFGLISAVLLLGNISYVKRHAYHSDENAYIENEEVVDLVAQLLHIKTETLVQALTMKRHVMKTETVVTRYSVSEAINTRDAMAKCLYNALFHWIVLRINQALMRKDVSGSVGYYIGILDIFGFEDVGAQWNSFEQLCINYANEHLQAYFNQHIFQFEQEEYQSQGICWTNIEYTDNTDNINNGTDESMLAKLNQFLKTNEYYETPQRKEPAFIIAHYAGKVKYQITGFREKNKDLMRQDVLNALKTSKCAMLKSMLGSDPVAVYRWSLARTVFRAISAFKQSGKKLSRSESAGHLRVLKEVPEVRRGSDTALSQFLRGDLHIDLPDFCDTSMFKTIVNQARRTPAKGEERISTVRCLQMLKETIGKRPISNKPASVSRQFEYSLNRLMNTLAHSTPYFIRCIKSNNDKIPNHFDDNIILRQLRYTGMLETAFVQQYRVLLPNGLSSTKDDVKHFLNAHPSITPDSVQYGVSKIYMRDAEKLILDDHLHRVIMQHIDTLQRWFRTIIARKRFLRLKQGIVKIQALVRGVLVRSRLRRQAYAALVIQSHWRGYREEHRYRHLRDAVIAIQAAYRGREARKRIGDIPRGQNRGRIRVKRVQAVKLPIFDLNDPQSLAAFACSDDDLDSDDEAIECDATFILEDTKLKLIEESGDLGGQRRQSLAPTASTTKLRMMRRANSTDSNTMVRTDDGFKPLQLGSPTAKKKTGSRMGFTKAKKNLKALFGRRSNSVTEEDGMDMEMPTRTQNPQNTTYSGLLNLQQRIVPTCSAGDLSGPPSEDLTSKPRSPTSRDEAGSAYSRSSFNLNKTKQQVMLPWFHGSSTDGHLQTDPGNMIVESTEDLRQFSVFIFKKQSNLDQKKNKRDTVVDALFKKSLREFHMELIGYEAVLNEERAVLKYRDLITTFEGVLTKVCKEEKVSFPTTLGVNAFRGFLNEFMQNQKKRGSKQKSGIIKLHNGHRFKADLVHVPTYCEVCNQFMWHAEKIFICIGCRISCHKKCHSKITHSCSMMIAPSLTSGTGGRFFGAVLSTLVDEDHLIPPLVDRLFMNVETRALFVEGVYRKSGSLAQVRNIRRIIETAPDFDAVPLDDVQVHVLTTLVKAFLREMPEPLITFDLYENFLNVSEVDDGMERGRCLAVMIDLLPKSNRGLLDRLMFHLARVAHQEAVNKMGPSNLALIFGPCILRRQDNVHAQEQLNDVSRQAICVQTLIEEKLRQYKTTLINIVELEDASQKVSANLRRIEEHQHLEEPTQNIGTAKQLFEEQLDFLGRQKERLLQELPPLAPVASSEDLSSSDEHSSGITCEEYAIDMDAPPVFGVLYHACKYRAPPPKGRKPPSRFRRPPAVVFYTPVPD
uniref:Unconventional myosin-IXb (inferred by orthology to a human protein) n=1 Tax=Nippostrongylus brasiliensis TaxID=27835 RepID=A0A158QZM2_NIPBR